jgi:hypothetical protein
MLCLYAFLQQVQTETYRRDNVQEYYDLFRDTSL